MGEGSGHIVRGLGVCLEHLERKEKEGCMCLTDIGKGTLSLFQLHSVGNRELWKAFEESKACFRRSKINGKKLVISTGKYH